jgi:hypothetical protein
MCPTPKLAQNEIPYIPRPDPLYPADHMAGSAMAGILTFAFIGGGILCMALGVIYEYMTHGVNWDTDENKDLIYDAIGCLIGIIIATLILILIVVAPPVGLVVGSFAIGFSLGYLANKYMRILGN